MATTELLQARVEGQPSIYAYELPEVPSHRGLLKVGYTVRTAEERVAEQCRTAHLKYKIVLVRSAMKADGTSFDDHLMSTHACCHDVAGWFEWTCTGILVFLLLNVLRMKLQHKSACSCGHCHTDPLCPHGHLPHNGESHAACSSTANTPDGSPLPITGEGQGERLLSPINVNNPHSK